jgi:hypothetical protein
MLVFVILSPDVVARPTPLTEPLAVTLPLESVTVVPSPAPMVADVAETEPRMVVVLVCKGPAMTAPPDAPMLLVKKEFVEIEEPTSVEVWIVEAAMSLAPTMEFESIWMEARAGYRAQSATFEISPAFANNSLL